MNRHFDAIVIGAGQAGPPMVGRLAASGRKVALIERDLIGGTCVNTGCTPTKTMVASAYAAHLARRAMDFGVKIGPVGIDFAAVMARKNAVVGNSRSHLTDVAGRHGELHCHPRPRPLPLADDSRRSATRCSRRSISSSMSEAGRFFPTFRDAIR